MLENRGEVCLTFDPNGTEMIPISTRTNRFSNGDFIFLHPKVKPTAELEPNIHNVDKLMLARHGRMSRQLDTRTCRHGPSGMCEHCQPLEPWQVPSVASAKHLPVHAWLRKTRLSLDGLFGFERADVATKTRLKCPHSANAKCSRCLPQSIALGQQPYRLVDHVEFSGSSTVEQVIGEWRKTGLQRFGWLFGEHLPRSSDEWDLGIKTVVRFVYQPSQENGADGVRLLDDDDDEQAAATAAARAFRAELVGCLYTDLHDDNSGTGKVIPRGYFVSSSELAFMSRQQHATSRFVTCIASGSAPGDIEVEAYMCSQSGVEAMCSDLLAPSTDPNSLIVKTTTEFIYSEKNSYGYEVPVRAGLNSTVPVDYFIVSLTHGFSGGSGREGIDTFPVPCMHPSTDQALEAIGSGSVSFNLLIFLFQRYGIFDPYDADAMDDTCTKLLEDGMTNTEFGWTCPHCTFINAADAATDCTMCGLPKAN